MSSFDPHPAPVRSYSRDSVQSYGIFRCSPYVGNTSTYPDPVTGKSDSVNYYDRFFSKYKDDLLIVNGVDNETGDHPSAYFYASTGGLALPYPHFTALTAASTYPSLPMSYCGDNTRGIIGGSQANMQSLQAASGPLLRMASPNLADLNSPDQVFQTSKAWDDVLAAISARVGRLQSLERVAARAQQRALVQVARANTDGSAVSNMLHDLFSRPVNPNDAAATIDVLMGCFKASLASAATISIPSGALAAVYNNFDAHAEHDARIYPLLDATFRLIDYAQSSAQASNIPLNIMVTSDFSRSAYYNGGGGTDHNSGCCSYLFMGPDFPGGRQLGASAITEAGYVGLPVSPTTLQEDPKGVNLTAAHIHAALRHVAGIESGPLAGRFPIDRPVLPFFTT